MSTPKLGALVRLSDAARSVWGKTHVDHAANHELIRWLPLVQHLDDTAGIAAKLWDEWIPQSTRVVISRMVGSADAARDLLLFLAGVHDVGKASPAFAVQVASLADKMREHGLVCSPEIASSKTRRAARHELVGYLAVRDWLVAAHDFDGSRARDLASVVAAHHGRPATAAEAFYAESLDQLVGSGAWVKVRREILDGALAAYASPESMDVWRECEPSRPVLVVLSSLVIVADWIASSDVFPSAALGEAASESTDLRVDRAWRALEFPRAWQPSIVNRDAASMLAARFVLPPGAAPRPMQAALVKLAHQIERPELMIVEDEMGSGKTEAALLAAEVLADRFGAGGIFVGLPTQATSDGMFTRVLKWADRLGMHTPASVFLARSRATLNEEFAQKTAASFRSISDTEGADAESESLLIAHRWFSAPRRGPLSNFVVGTVDQALYAGLRSRYLMLRHLALASKVVVIDEVHAYDEYMEQYLTRVLEWLGAYGTPVILLSATLPATQRRRFLEAYDRGREALAQNVSAENATAMSARERQRVRAERDSLHEARYVGAAHGEYPAIAVSQAGAAPLIVRPPSVEFEPRVVQLEWIDDEDATLIDLVRTAVQGGGNIAVIRHTVRRAQHAARILRDALGPDVPVILAHARFLGVDRARNDRMLIEAYGPIAKARPVRSVVVATQVLEQSLDVDFDLMLSDLGPVDLVLQRSGRLHRHRARQRPENLRQPRLVITGIDVTTTPPTFDSASTMIYSEALLLRTQAALHDRERLRIPDDIAPLVAAVYGDQIDVVPESWRDALALAVRNRERAIAEREQKAQSFRLGPVTRDQSTLLGWITGPDVDPELGARGRATVRDGEETLEVIVLQRADDGELTLPVWIEGGGERIPRNSVPSARLARRILGCTLRLPLGMCRGDAIDRHISTLERAFELPEWHASHALRGELVLVLDARGHVRLNEFELDYSPQDGLTYTRCAKSDT